MIKVVDRLLASSAYGEHWARMWLDLARFADTKGYEKDRHRDVWRYRDWVIDAFNHDMPFDQFTIEQLAGDLLPEPSADQMLATAFHRNTMENDEGGTDNEEFPRRCREGPCRYHGSSLDGIDDGLRQVPFPQI